MCGPTLLLSTSSRLKAGPGVTEKGCQQSSIVNAVYYYASVQHRKVDLTLMHVFL